MAETMDAEVAERYVGQGVPRKEDPALITGEARFIEDMTIPGMLWAGIVRSPFAHAHITGVDLSAAKEMAGIVDAFSGADLASEWADGLPCAWPVTEDIKIPKHWPVAQDVARFAGEAVAVVIGDSRAHVKDALESVDVSYDPLDPVLDLENPRPARAAVPPDEARCRPNPQPARHEARSGGAARRGAATALRARPASAGASSPERGRNRSAAAAGHGSPAREDRTASRARP